MKLSTADLSAWCLINKSIIDVGVEAISAYPRMTDRVGMCDAINAYQ